MSKTNQVERKTAIILRNVFWDKEGGKALIEIPDPDMEKPSQKFTLKINDMITPYCKEWKELGNA